MANETTCLKCGAPLTGDARGGFCPKCLFAQASAGDFGDLAHASQIDPSGTGATEAFGSSDHACTSTATGLPLPRGFGDYELLEEIARGGMGIVYRARQVSLDRIVAVKMLLFGPLSSPEFVKRFRAEASAAASLQHPNIVAIHEVGVHQGQQYFAMDYVEGQSLAKLLANGPLPVRHAACYIKTIAEAIHYAHERGLLHRDLKPANVLIDATDQPRVTDFGLARRLEGDSELTVTGQVLGSPNYMPPEQATARRGKVSRRSDVYSLGAMLYHLLTGRPPFVGEALTDTLEQVLNAEPVSPCLLNPSVPRDLETICLKCLEKEPEKRYATAKALADEFSRFLNNEPVHARAVTRAERVWRWCRRKPALASFVAATSVLLVAILIGSPIALYRINQARKAEQLQLKRAEAGELSARQHLYVSDMNVAHQAIKDGDLFRALQRLEAHRPANTSGKSEMDLRAWEWRYFWKQCQGDQRFILGYHSNGVSAVGVFSNGTVFSAGYDKAVRLWDLQSRKQIGLLAHDDDVSGAACSPDGLWMATGSRTKSTLGPLRLWDLATRQEVAVLATNFWLRSTIVFSPDSKLLVFLDFHQGLRLWSLAARQEITNLPAYFHYQSPLGVAFSPNGQILAYNENEGGDIVLWDVRTQSAIRRLAGHQWYVTALAFSPDGQLLASGGADRTVKLWNVAEHRELVTFTNLTGMARGVAFSPEGKMLACSWGQRITLLDVTTRSEIVQLRGHQSRATALAFTLDGRTLITGGGTGMEPGGDGSVRVWDVAARPRETDRQHYQTAVGEFSEGNGIALCLSPDGRHLLLVFVDNTFSIWETATLTESQHRPLPVAEFGCAALVSGGKVAAFVAKDGNVVFWHTDTGQTNWFAMRTSRRVFTRAAFSPDGQRFAVDCSGEVCVFDVASHNRLHTFSVRDGDEAHSLSFSRDGQRLMAGYGSGLVKVWGLAGNNEEATLRGHDHMVNDVALMSDGRTLVSASLDVRFWDLTSQRELFLPLRPRPTQFSGCSISPDGRRLAVGGIDGLITIWDLASRQEVATLKADERRVVDVAFLSDGKTLVSAGLGQLRVWRAASFDETDREDLKK